MQLLGASRWKVSGPFILEGLLAGILGGVIASLVLLGLDELALRTLLPSAITQLPKDADMMATLTLLALSAALGVLGSSLALAFGNKRV
jgi:cell division transport system permease protein